jgi:hypothetical protein
MPLILAIEPDHRQASQLRAMARGRLGADLVHADSAEPALIALAGRVPDLILVPALLSPADEAAIGGYLRALDGASAHVQTLIIPVLAANRPRSRRRGVLASLKRQQAPAPEGCDPKEFAEQCATYLQRAAAERERRAEAVADAAADAAADALVVEPVGELLTAPDAEALVEFAAQPQAQPLIEAALVEFVAEPQALPVIETALDELVAENQAQPAIEAAVEIPVVEAPVALAVTEPLERAVELSIDEDPPLELVAPARKLEFIELDLSTLVEELAGPNLAIPAEAPVTIAAVENAAPPPATAARATSPPTPPAAEPVEVIEKPVEVRKVPVARPRVAVKWTAVYSPPGRCWPSMEGVAVEVESAPSPPSPRGAAESIAARKAAPKAVQDEWGFFDPTRCGFTALLSKLDEITTADEAPLKQRA